MEDAFRNQLVLQRIFSYLPLGNLKKCRFVSTNWNFEIQSYIRVFRRCDVSISGEDPCITLSVLAGLASQVTALTTNSLTINFSYPPHSNCQSLQNGTKTYDELLKKFPLRYLDICLEHDYYVKSKQCPAVGFVMHLLQKKLNDLRKLTLSFPHVPCEVRDCYFGQGWTPTLLNLKVLEAHGIHSWKDMFLKILSAAPNLQKLIVDTDTLMVDVVPKEKYRLVGNCYLCLDSVQQQIPYSDFALALPALSKLVTNAPLESERQTHKRFFDVLEVLLFSSWNTLKILEMESVIFPLHQLWFPALVNLKELTIHTEATTEQTLHVLGSIDYPTMLPVLDTVQVTVYDGDETLYFTSWGNTASTLVPSPKPSTSVKNLTLSLEIDQKSLQVCGRIFANVSYLSLLQKSVELEEIPYEGLWAHWSQVEFMEVTETEIEFGLNFDAEFLGIHAEEVNLLRQIDDKSLEMMNIVPIRPSVLTMPRLKSLKIAFSEMIYISDDEYPNPDQVFLSKLTGILAFRKLTRTGIVVEINIDDMLIPYLEHLRPFATVV